jgi:hypothetical protein
MTTIAYRNGVIAADTQGENAGWITPGRSNKLRLVKPGVVAGITGEYERFESWLAWYNGDQREPFDLGDQTRIVLATSDGATVYEGKGWFRHDGAFGAWGSGWPAAVAAMHMGADAKRAIEIAAMLDTNTGGEIVAMEVR